MSYTLKKILAYFPKIHEILIDNESGKLFNPINLDIILDKCTLKQINVVGNEIGRY